MDILFEDNHLLIVRKPAGILTEPSGTDQDNLEDLAKAWIKEKYNKPGNVFLTATHRIDKPVSGIVVLAKTSKGLARMHASIRERKVRKHYMALVEGCPKQEEGSLEHFMIHDDYCAKIVHPSTPQSKKARLSYHVIDKQPSRSLLSIELETGRYHQIRVQLSAIGCPIIGDRKYGSGQLFKGCPEWIALHHSKIEFPHPISKEWLVIECPSDFHPSK